MANTRPSLAGKRFGSLIVVKRFGSKQGGAAWLCRCNCGQRTIIRGSSLRAGLTKSCGCQKNRDKVTHGLSSSPTYSTWQAMLTRCNNPKSKSYSRYGGRGIKVCKRWLKFENFLADMGEKPIGKEIDRRDNDGNYEPSNCRWVTHRKNSNNRVKNRKVTFEGKTLTLSQWARKLCKKVSTLSWRYRQGWNPREVLA